MKPTANAAQPPTVADEVSSRKITEVLHFTTNLGLLGIVGIGRVLSRRELPQDRYIEHVYSPNSKYRKDGAHLGYINLSISRINDWMFETSERWHVQDNVWWVILSFAPRVLSDDGVIFVTTNNIYPAARRGAGSAGLGALFSDVVPGRYGVLARRDNSFQSSWPTDRQAEVLYPRPLTLDSLEALYVRSGDHVDDIRGMMAGIPDAVNLSRVRIECRPEVFEE